MTQLVDGQQIEMLRARCANLEQQLADARSHIGYVGNAIERRDDESNEMLRALCDASPDLMVLSRGGEIVYVNQLVRKWLGVSPSTPIAPSLLESLAHPSERSEVRAWSQDVATDRAERGMPSVLLRSADGTEGWFELQAVSLMLGGRPTLLTVARDVTSRRSLEARLAAADRMALMGVLAAGIAHEINNPLAYVLANLEFVRDQIEGRANAEVELTDDLRVALVDSLTGATRIRDIVREFRVFSRPPTQTVGPVDARKTLEAAALMAFVQVKHRAHYTRQHDEPVPMVAANEAKLGQVLLNLVVNRRRRLRPACPPPTPSSCRPGCTTTVGWRSR